MSGGTPPAGTGDWRVVWRSDGERLLVERQHGSDHPRHRFRSNEPGDGSVVVARDGEGRVLFLEIARPIVGRTLLELPRGQADAEDADPVETAARELLEESGHRMIGGTVLGRIWPDSGLCGDGVHVVVATGIELGAVEAAEHPQQRWLDPDALAAAVRDGEVRDAISLAAVAVVRAAGA